MIDEDHHHVLSVLVEDKSGVLARVAGLFAQRGYNIESLAVAPTSDPGLSRITITVNVDTAPLEQMVKQLNKLVNVLKITELDPRHSVERELMLVTVRAEPNRRREVIELTQVFNGRILDVGHHAVTVALDARPDRLNTFEQLLTPYGVVSLQRTGRVALPKIDDQRSGS